MTHKDMGQCGSLRKELFERLSICVWFLQRFLTQSPIVSVRGMLVKSDFTSKLVIIRLGLNSSNSSANENK